MIVSLVLSGAVIASGSASVAAVNCPPPNKDVTVPLSFTPNNDGRNDVLKIFTGDRNMTEFVVYSRRGDQVFFSKSTDVLWDGSNARGHCPTGVYLWVMRYVDEQGNSKEAVGTVTLLR